jgi:hypothetical protein
MSEEDEGKCGDKKALVGKHDRLHT